MTSENLNIINWDNVFKHSKTFQESKGPCWLRSKICLFLFPHKKHQIQNPFEFSGHDENRNDFPSVKRSRSPLPISI